jgi:CDP-diacylglycerol--glycerol-3-phosphate 3-phosphatidyltransferase
MKQVFTVPNILTGFRLALIPVLIILFSIRQSTDVELVTLWVFTVAACTDFIDGYVAGKYHIETGPIGKRAFFLDCNRRFEV